MVKLRLSRRGAKKKPFYRIVAMDERKRRDGRFMEQLGHYDTKQDPPALLLDVERAEYWLGLGAAASPTVASLIKRARREAAAPA